MPVQAGRRGSQPPGPRSAVTLSSPRALYIVWIVPSSSVPLGADNLMTAKVACLVLAFGEEALQLELSLFSARCLVHLCHCVWTFSLPAFVSSTHRL